MALEILWRENGSLGVQSGTLWGDERKVVEVGSSPFSSDCLRDDLILIKINELTPQTSWGQNQVCDSPMNVPVRSLRSAAAQQQESGKPRRVTLASAEMLKQPAL